MATTIATLDHQHDDRNPEQRVGADALELLLSRQSVGLLAEPGPTTDALSRILDAGLCAPDHGRLRPWRFILVQGAAREVLGGIFADALQAPEPQASEALIERHRTM